MTVTHTGSTRKYSENWERVFGKTSQSKRKQTGGSAKAKSSQSKKTPARKAKGTAKSKKR